MPKIRKPASIEKGLEEVIQILTEDEIVNSIGKSSSYLRKCSDPEQNYWNLVNDAILCDVAVERQVEITGPDAAKFMQMLTPRDLSNMSVGQCKYILITNEDGGILNDPILLRLGKNHFWISHPLVQYDQRQYIQVHHHIVVRSGIDCRIQLKIVFSYHQIFVLKYSLMI